MTNYVQIERDFIERTLEILEQYEKYVLPNVNNQKEYSVTLLVNCLLGVLVYPQQVALKTNLDDWLKDQLVKDLDNSWGIKLSNIKNAGFYSGNGERILLAELNLRDLVRQIRNSATHAHFAANEFTAGIEEIIFSDHRTDGFCIVIPIDSLKVFVIKMANLALDDIIN